MMSDSHPFGEDAAAGLEKKTGLPLGWFSNTWPTPKESETNGWAVDRPYPNVVYAETEQSVVINQFDVSGGMGADRLILEPAPPGIIKSWRVNRDWLRLNLPPYTRLQNLCIVTGYGPSMKPMFNPGDPLLLDRGVTTVDHEGVYFFRVGDSGFIKILQRVPNFDGGGFVLRVISKNPDFPSYELSPQNPDFHVLGKVLMVWRSEQY
jgi:hypothetical protein